MLAMLFRFAMILMLLAPQMPGVRACVTTPPERINSSGEADRDSAARHRVRCGESCCCAPDNCPCMASRQGGEPKPPMPAPETPRLQRFDLTISLPHSPQAYDAAQVAAFRRAKTTVSPPSARSAARAILGVWLT
jgi:hypothetical protein